MDWIKDGLMIGCQWRNSGGSWREMPEGDGAMRYLFKPVSVALPDDCQPIDADELEELAALLDAISGRWNRPLRLALGPGLPSRRANHTIRGRYEPGNPGWLLLALSAIAPGERGHILCHELWHLWSMAPVWQAGEADAILAYGNTVRAAIRQNPALGAGRSWLRMDGGGEVEAEAFAVTMTDGAWPARMAPGPEALAAFRRIGGC